MYLTKSLFYFNIYKRLNLKEIAIIILNWNGEKLLEKYLPSVINNTSKDLADIIVADNNSTDNSIEFLNNNYSEGIKIISLDKNYGFAGGYNRIIEDLDYKYVVLLNSDVEVSNNWLEPLYKLVSQNKEIAVVQPKICAFKDKTKFEYAGAAGGYIDIFGFPFCRGRILNSVESDVGQYDDTTEVMWCSGAALFIKRDVYMKVGGMDERFFAHMEEIDMCWRISNLGYKLYETSNSLVWHLGGGTLPMNHPHKLFLNYRNNLLMLYKNMPFLRRFYIMFIRFFMDLASAFIFLIQGKTNNFASVLKAYIAFLKMKKYYKSPSKYVKNKNIYKGSIVLKYFISAKKFSDLKWKH